MGRFNKSINVLQVPEEGNSFGTIRQESSSMPEMVRANLHEMVHAEIFRTMNTANSSPGEIWFKNTFETYTKQFYRDKDIHHNFMANH